MRVRPKAIVQLIEILTRDNIVSLQLDTPAILGYTHFYLNVDVN